MVGTHALFSILNLTAAASASVIVYAVVRMALRRKSSYPWINLLFALNVCTIGWDFLQHALATKTVMPMVWMIVESVAALFIIACAIAILPMQRRICSIQQYDELQEANRLLEHHRQILDRFLNELPGISYILDAGGRLVHVNGRFAGTFCRPSSYLRGKTLTELLGAVGAAQINENNRLVLESQSKSEFVEDMYLGGQLSKWLSIKFPVVDRKGARNLGVISLEITEAINSMDMNCILASLVDMLPDPVYTVDGEGMITSWNAAAENLLGYKSEEIIGKPASMITPPDARKAPLNALNHAGNRIVGFETVHLARDGRQVDVSISASRIRSLTGKGFHYSCLTRDITAFKRAEREVWALNQELNKSFLELSRANEELQEARDQALEASAVKSTFACHVSHELRTALSGILGLSELLLQKPLESGLKEMVTTVDTSARALLTVINDILDLSDLESGRLCLQNLSFSPASLLSDCIKLMAPLAAEKMLKLELCLDSELPPCVTGDAARVKQILLNLLSNALKYTETGAVTVDAALVSQDSKIARIKFSVRDTGAGIAPAEQTLLFAPFSRLGEAKKVGGTGLGLAISKSLTVLMGGEIGVDSVERSGSIFWFSIPFVTAPGLQPVTRLDFEPAPAVSMELLLRHLVLAVEDNPVLAELITRQLACIGIKADCVSSGREALPKALTGRYDIILLDVHLPDMSGYEVAKIIRQTEKDEHRPAKAIIALTAGAMIGDREKALQSGMDDYLVKPVSIADLRSMIVKWFSKLNGVDQSDALLFHEPGYLVSQTKNTMG